MSIGRSAAMLALALCLGACATGTSPSRTVPPARTSAPPPVYSSPAPIVEAPRPRIAPEPAPAPSAGVTTQPLPDREIVTTHPAPPAATFSPPGPAAPPAVVVAPGAAPSNGTAEKAAPQGKSNGLIALVLPLQSSVFGHAAEAVAAGFTAAADAAHARFVVVGHRDGEALSAIEQARDGGAAVIVGPLLRDDVKAVSTSGLALPPTVALNAVDEATPLPPAMYTLALSIEGEARQIARSVSASGAQNVAIVTSDSPLQRRFAASFTGEWILLGGRAPTSFRFLRDPDSLALLRRELTRTPFDAIVLAADGLDAASVKPYLGQTPVYASSQVNDRLAPEMTRDLDGIRFVELPWLAQQETDRFADLPRREWSDPTLDRLYALGHDAFEVATALVAGKGAGLQLDGATGHLTLEPGRQIAREGVLMRFEGGRPQPDAP